MKMAMSPSSWVARGTCRLAAVERPLPRLCYAESIGMLGRHARRPISTSRSICRARDEGPSASPKKKASRKDLPRVNDVEAVRREHTQRAKKGDAEVEKEMMNHDGRAAREDVETRTREWAERFVVGLRLCPFARLHETRIVCASREESADLPSLLALLRSEIDFLHHNSHVASTLVVLPEAEHFADFETFNAAVNIVTEELSTDDDGEEVETIHQIAQFHPQFRYADVEDSVENYTSRSPYPTVHLIRASLIAQAREKLGENYLLQIPDANARRLLDMGLERVRKLYPRASGVDDS